MSRFDRIVDNKNAETTEAERKAAEEKKAKELETERRKAQYLPIIRKYWQQFQEVIPRLTYSGERKVYSSFLFISWEKDKKIRWFTDYCRNDFEYGFDARGNLYRRGDYSTYHAKGISIEEIVFEMLPWKTYSHAEDWSDEKRKWCSIIRKEMLDGNVDEAVAKYFESLI